jgi:acyl CoA:acetate/3-ketoacid CoA transferase alpha subunit
MHILAESLPGRSVRDKVVSTAEAVRLIRDGDSVVVEGFMGQCFAEELTLALEQRFLQTGRPRGLGLVFTVAQGNRQGRGLDRLCHEGLLKRAVGGHWGMSAELGKMAVGGKIEAHNLPQGVISQLSRRRGGRPGLLTRVGLGIFVDPRHGGGKINERTTEDRAELITLDGAEYLFYKALSLDVAFHGGPDLPAGRPDGPGEGCLVYLLDGSGGTCWVWCVGWAGAVAAGGDGGLSLAGSLGWVWMLRVWVPGAGRVRGWPWCGFAGPSAVVPFLLGVR